MENIYKRLNAKDLSRRRMDLKAILIKHDIAAFRAFMDKDGDGLVDPPLRLTWVTALDSELSDTMHAIKSSQPYLGEVFQASRNHFRIRQLAKTRHLATEELKQELDSDDDEFPLCVKCKYFREAPSVGEVPCMHMGSLPGDIACAGWTPA